MKKIIAVILMLVCAFSLDLSALAAEANDLMVPVVDESNEVVGYLVLQEPGMVATRVSSGTVIGEGVRIRKEPSTTSVILGLLYRNESVVINYISGSWYNITTVRAPLITGFVYGELIAR